LNYPKVSEGRSCEPSSLMCGEEYGSSTRVTRKRLLHPRVAIRCFGSTQANESGEASNTLTPSIGTVLVHHRVRKGDMSRP